MNTKLIKMLTFLAFLYFFPVLCLAAVLVRHLDRGVAVHYFMREPQVLGGLHPLAGVISNLGVLFFAACAAILFFSSFVLWRLNKERDFLPFLLYSAVLTSILLADDFFMFHECLFKAYLGLQELHSYAAYIFLFFIGGVVFRKQLLNTEYILLLVVFGFWGMSVLIDMGHHQIERYIDGNYRILVEDGFKYLGIVTWAGYFARICFREIIEVMHEEKSA